MLVSILNSRYKDKGSDSQLSGRIQHPSIMHKKKENKVLEGGGRGCIGDGRRGGSVGGEKGAG